MRRLTNTDCTDYTDNLFGDADSSLSSVMRRFLNTDYTDCTDIFCLETFPLSSVMRRVLNTDCTDYTDAFYWGILRMNLWSHCEEAQNYP